MRVIAGTARSLPLRCPEGMDTRPTTDRIKETLFNILQPYIEQSVFVDLFSGSGGIGIEALSRGAKKAYFVDISPKAVGCIQHNLSFTKLADRGIVLKQDVIGALSSIREEEADLVFMDPPYGQDLERQTLSFMRTLPFITENTRIIVEADLKTDFGYLDDIGYRLEREKVYKTNRHLFIRKK